MSDRAKLSRAPGRTLRNEASRSPARTRAPWTRIAPAAADPGARGGQTAASAEHLAQPAGAGPLSPRAEAIAAEAGRVTAEMGRAFGMSFDEVTIRTDREAGGRADAMNALAYTDGREIGFARGQFAPHTRAGLHTIAHEFAHVAQRRGGNRGGAAARAGAVSAKSANGGSEDTLELEADQAAHAVLGGQKPEIGAAVFGVLAKKAVPKLPPTPPRGIFKVNSAGGAFWLTYNSSDLLPYDPVGLKEKLFTDYVQYAFPNAPRSVIKEMIDADVIAAAIPPEWWETDGSQGEVAIPMQIQPKLHRDTTAWLKSHHPEVKSRADFVSQETGTGTGKGTGEGEGKGAKAGPKVIDPFGPKKKKNVNGRVVLMPDALKDQWDKLLSILKEIVPQPDPSKPPPAPPPPELFLSARAAELLLQIDAAPPEQRQAIIESLRRSGAPSATPPSLEEVLETAVANEDIKSARMALGLEPPSAGAEGPVVRRPVHGQIRNLSDRLVPGKKAQFTFEVFDQVDALRVPYVSIHWVAHPRGNFDRASWVSEEITSYGPMRGQSILDDRIFDFTFDTSGPYTIEAFVNHNFFLPAHFTQEVDVKTEEEVIEEMKDVALQGFVQGKPTSVAEHEFGGISYTKGVVSKGVLAPDQKPKTIAQWLADAKPERDRVEALKKSYSGQSSDDAKAIVKWCDDYLKALDDAEKSLNKEAEVGGTPLGVRGSYVSRSKSVPSRESLSLLAYYNTLDFGGVYYRLVLDDFSRVFESDNYHFVAGSGTFERAAELVFMSAAHAYPNGTLSLTFQTVDPKTKLPVSEYVQFTKVTDSIEKDVKSAVFDTAVDVVVNIAAVALMLVPGLQPLGFGLAALYNSAKTLSEMSDEELKGTLTTEKTAIDLGMIALNLLPLAGRGAKLVTIAGKTFYAMEAVQLAGMTLVMTAEGLSKVDELRNGIVSDLAKKDAQIRAIEGVNDSDPRLTALRAERKKLIEDATNATRDVFLPMALQNAAFMVGTHLLHASMPSETPALKKGGAPPPPPLEGSPPAAETKAPLPEAKVPAPEAKAPAPEAKPPMPEAKPPEPAVKPPTPGTETPPPEAKPPAAEAKPPVPEAKPAEPEMKAPETKEPAPETKPPAPETKAPAPEPKAAPEAKKEAKPPEAKAAEEKGPPATTEGEPVPGVSEKPLEAKMAEEEAGASGKRLTNEASKLESFHAEQTASRPKYAPPKTAEESLYNDWLDYVEQRVAEIRAGDTNKGPLTWEAYRDFRGKFVRGIGFQGEFTKQLQKERPKAIVISNPGINKPEFGTVKGGGKRFKFPDQMVVDEDAIAKWKAGGRKPADLPEVETFSDKSRDFKALENDRRALEAQVQADIDAALADYGGTFTVHRPDSELYLQTVKVKNVTLVYDASPKLLSPKARAMIDDVFGSYKKGGLALRYEALTSPP